jgi:hypothetical protein
MARDMERAARAFADFYKSERARCELCLETILSILCDSSDDPTKIEKVLGCLESHWGRYDTMPARAAFDGETVPAPAEGPK